MTRIEILNKDKKFYNKTFNHLLLPQNTKILKKNLYKSVDTMWYLAGDNSTDFNFYTKRYILSQIFINTLIYWRGSESIEKTVDFINSQIVALGKFGYYKSRFKKVLTSLYKNEILTKFDFLHKN